NFTQQEAQDLALTLRSGSLPATLTYLEERTIGPTLGADSIRSGVIASIIGLLLIVLFMLVYYRLSGVNAVVALLFNLVILFGLMSNLFTSIFVSKTLFEMALANRQQQAATLSI